MRERDRVCGLLWALLDREGDRDAADLPEKCRGHMRALYAAVEVYTAAEVAVVESARMRGWTWTVRVLTAVLRLVWCAGQLGGRVDGAVRGFLRDSCRK